MKAPQAVWISQELLAALAAEATRTAPLETGGVLLGYVAPISDELVVTHVLGPGPNAIHERQRFVPDHEYHARMVAQMYAKSSRRLAYLGDWHTHPGGEPLLSTTDRSTLKRIATSAAARCRRPVLLILSPGPDWAPAAWAGLARGVLRRRLVTVSIPIRLF